MKAEEASATRAATANMVVDEGTVETHKLAFAEEIKDESTRAFIALAWNVFGNIERNNQQPH